MDLQNYVTFVSALIFVLALMLLIAWIVRRLGLGGAVPTGGRQKRLAIVEMLALDTRRRLVLVRRDDVEHLLLLGPEADRVVETGIRPSFRAAVAEAVASSATSLPETQA